MKVHGVITKYLLHRKDHIAYCFQTGTVLRVKEGAIHNYARTAGVKQDGPRQAT